jgi:hypothetical protein
MPNMAQQGACGASLLVSQIAQRLLLRFIPLRRSPGMMAFIQNSQAILVPTLSPVFNAIQVHYKLVGYLLQR